MIDSRFISGSFAEVSQLIMNNTCSISLVDRLPSSPDGRVKLLTPNSFTGR